MALNKREGWSPQVASPLSIASYSINDHPPSIPPKCINMHFQAGKTYAEKNSLFFLHEQPPHGKMHIYAVSDLQEA
jgi:hypothetical protein